MSTDDPRHRRRLPPGNAADRCQCHKLHYYPASRWAMGQSGRPPPARAITHTQSEFPFHRILRFKVSSHTGYQFGIQRVGLVRAERGQIRYKFHRFGGLKPPTGLPGI
jgi:hypothetical protein